MKLLFLGRHFQACRATTSTPGPAHDHERHLIFSISVETDVLKAPMSASGIIGTFLGVRSPGTAYVCSTTTWEKLTARFRAWGFAAVALAQFRTLSVTRPAKRCGDSHASRHPRKSLSKTGKAKGVVLANGDEIGKTIERQYSLCQKSPVFERLMSSRKSAGVGSASMNLFFYAR